MDTKKEQRCGEDDCGEFKREDLLKFLNIFAAEFNNSNLHDRILVFEVRQKEWQVDCVSESTMSEELNDDNSNGCLEPASEFEMDNSSPGRWLYTKYTRGSTVSKGLFGGNDDSKMTREDYEDDIKAIGQQEGEREEKDEKNVDMKENEKEQGQHWEGEEKNKDEKGAGEFQSYVIIQCCYNLDSDWLKTCRQFSMSLQAFLSRQ